MTPRERAHAHGNATYHGRQCGWDGSTERFTGTNRCVACAQYRKGISAGRIDGIDGRKERKAAEGAADYAD